MSEFDDFKKYHNANYHDGDDTFDEITYRKTFDDDFDCEFVQHCYDHFEAGAQSKQAEIDELRKMIDEALKNLNLAYSDSWSYCVDEAINILKGTTNEH